VHRAEPHVEGRETDQDQRYNDGLEQRTQHDRQPVDQPLGNGVTTYADPEQKVGAGRRGRCPVRRRDQSQRQKLLLQ
jgi:hypothetical protein